MDTIVLHATETTIEQTTPATIAGPAPGIIAAEIIGPTASVTIPDNISYAPFVPICCTHCSADILPFT